MNASGSTRPDPDPDEDPSEPSRRGSDPSPLLILVADDEPVVRMVLRRILEERGHRVDEAEDAPGARRLLAETTPDAAVVDLDMPGGGVSLIDTLEGTEGFEGPVLLMSAHVDAEEEVRGRSDVTVVRKPFRFAWLADLVEAECGRRSHPGPARKRGGG